MERLFTPVEAAAVTGITSKAVHNAIDKRIVEPAAAAGTPHGARLLNVEALVRLIVWRGTGASLSSEQRNALFAAMASSPRARTLGAGGLLIVDIAEARRQVDRGIRGLAAAEAIVATDKDILGGEPVIKGTRIPVHAIAVMRAAGATTEDLIAGYPGLSRRSLELAVTWSRAHPRRGRPRPLALSGFKIKGTKVVPPKEDPLTRRGRLHVPAAE